jgi:3-deoxy-manno-octulosonate cytidylyltransferase (CMP-KDO synthetase)
MKVIGLIPSRLESSRLPNKALLDIEGLPMIVHVLKRTQLSKQLDEVYVCTDSKLIADSVEKHGGSVIYTSPSHINGTERIAEAASSLTGDLFVDIQGDEPLIDPSHIDSVVNYHKKNLQFEIILPTIPLLDFNNPHIVKVVKGMNSQVVYLSRAPVPFNSNEYLKHLSIISFTPNGLWKFATLPASHNEIIERVELLRAIDYGMTIGTFNLTGDSFSVDVWEDYIRAKIAMSTDQIKLKYA